MSVSLSVNIPKFDVVEYIRKLRNAGATQELAEVQAQEMEHIIGEVLLQSKQDAKELFNSSDLATKGDLRETELRLQKEIKELELRINSNIDRAKITTIIWVGIFFITNGILIHFLK
jgi:hypothetical protein